MLGWILVASFMVLSGMAALRLFGLWRRTRKLPELLVSLLIFGLGTVAVGLGCSLRMLLPPGTARELGLFLPFLGAQVGMSALGVFTWRVYRPSSARAGVAAAVLTAGMTGLLGYAALRGSTQVLDQGLLLAALNALYVATMGWCAVESLSYWAAMRRRLRIGLADPLVTHQLLLCGIAAGICGLGIAIGAAGRGWGGIVDFERSWVAICYVAHGVVGAVAFWLAFQPPRVYARWIEARAAAAGSLADAGEGAVRA